METIVVDGKEFEIPVEVKDLIDGFFNTLEGLRLELSKELDLDYLSTNDLDILEAIKILKKGQ
jgi:hypothetical protein